MIRAWPESGLHPAWGSDRRRDELREQAVRQVVERLVPEVDAMLRELAARLLERQAG